jgi:hypothetical protein
VKAIAIALLVGGLGSAAPSPEEAAAARQWAQQLQDDARTLRNGVRSGAAAAVLSRERDRLTADLEQLVEAYTRWAAALDAGERARVEAPLGEMHRGCEEIRRRLAELGVVLQERHVDAGRVQAIGRAIGGQALACERRMREAERAARIDHL